MKPSAAVPDDVDLAVIVDRGDPGYASRAALKLAGALDALAPSDVGRRLADVAGAWCLDLGASTGGFTDVLLRRGAVHVVALDVGHGQLVPRLREDLRVTVVEGYNVRDLDVADLERTPDLVVGDLSFISLTLVLGAVAAVLDPGASALLLVKPQFEVGKDRLGAGGVVRDPALHAKAVLDVVAAAAEVGLCVRAVVPSPLPGPRGNREFFVAFLRGESGPAQDARASAGEAVAGAVEWTPDASGAVRPPVLAVPPGAPRAAVVTATGSGPASAAPSVGVARDGGATGAETGPEAVPRAPRGTDLPAAVTPSPGGSDPDDAETAASGRVDPTPSSPSRTGGAP